MSSIDPYAQNVESLREQLMRFARLQLRNEAWAEDAVSETILAALEKPRAFDGRSQLKTWLVGILKHKLIDQVRRHTRECALADEQSIEDIDADLFTPDGHYREGIAAWGDPQAQLSEFQFMQVLEACLDGLPAQLGRVFMMRDWLELETDEICKELSISATNLWVILHRARTRLRICLQQRWFDAPQSV